MDEVTQEVEIMEPQALSGEGETPVEVSETAESAPEVGEVQADSATADDEKGSGFQKRIKDLVDQRNEWREQAEHWRRQVQPGQQEQQQRPETRLNLPEKPKVEQFETYEAYVEALADFKAEERLQRFTAQQTERYRAQTQREWLDRAVEKYPDFRETVMRPDVPVSESMAEAIYSSDQGADIAYYLAQHRQEAAKISQMPPIAAARAIGRLEARLGNPAPQKNETKAPSPTKPVSGNESLGKSLEDMSYEEYSAARAKQLGWR